MVSSPDVTRGFDLNKFVTTAPTTSAEDVTQVAVAARFATSSGKILDGHFIMSTPDESTI